MTCPGAGATVNVGIDASKVVITKLKMDNDRKNLLERKKVRGCSVSQRERGRGRAACRLLAGRAAKLSS